MSKTLLKRNIVTSYKLFLIFSAIMILYNGIVIYMYNPELSKMIAGFQEAMPQMMSIAGMMGVQDTLLQFIHTYLYGFIMMIFPIIYSIILIQRMVVRYVDSGSMACLLATPNSRRKIMITQMLSAILNITLLLVCIAVVGIFCAESMFPGELDLRKYIYLNGALIAFHIALNAITFFSACIFDDTKYFYAAGAGIPIVFFLIDRVKDMGEKLEPLKYITIFTMFPDQAIVSGDGEWIANCLVLLGIAVFLYSFGIHIFCKKDLPL